MNVRGLPAVAALMLIAALAACESSKSENPLSPSVAGPIPGVTITAPRMLEPTPGERISIERQPVTLLIENASTNGVRPLSYSFDIATDAAFNTKVFSRASIAQGDGGRTSVRLPEALATGYTYYWRARAVDGANEGPYATAASFAVFTPIVIGAPALVSPGINVTVDSVRPRFTFTNAARSGPVGAMSYLLEIAENDSFTNRTAQVTGAEQPSQTTLDIPADLAVNKVYYWHVRAYDPTTQGPWSAIRAFATPTAPTSGPYPSPDPNAPAAAPDMWPLANATILNSPRDLARWPITTAIALVDIRAEGVRVDFSKKDGPGRWPDTIPPGWEGPLQYTLGMVLNINNQLYASAPVEFWYGLPYSGGPPSQYALNWFYDPARWAPMTTHQPSPGEQIGFFVCAGDCRNSLDGSKSPVKERSNVVVVTMPTDAGATFRF